MNCIGEIPMPSGTVAVQLACIAANVEQALLAPDHTSDKPPVGLTTAKNERRRAMENILVLLRDPGVREYVAELERQGLLPLER